MKKINEYYNSDESKKQLFTTPSHSQGEFVIPELDNIVGKTYLKNDFSEIEGFDNLRNPTGILKKLQKKITKIYDTKQTFILTNGSTSGILAIMLATLKENDKVLVARNCHISVHNGFVLSGAKPVWFLPEYDNNWGIYKGVTKQQIESLLKLHKNIKALIITSPTYEGIFSEIEEISQICRQNNIIFIVDEAHGALLNYTYYKEYSALNYNVDACVHSLHKNTGAPNPCALLHIPKLSTIDVDRIQNTLNLINTTSPSYPMIASIEATVNYLNSFKGKKHVNSLISNIKSFHKALNPNINVLIGNNDITKILLKIDGYTGYEIAEILNNSLIEEEFSNAISSLFLTGIGTSKEKLQYLAKELNKIQSNHSAIKISDNQYKLPKMKLTPKNAFNICNEKIKSIDINKALNKISAEVITVYPPGIPIIMPGEIIDKNVINLVKNQHNPNFKINIIKN